jgi:hypothetical protein
VTEFLKKAETRLAEEEHRVHMYLHETTLPKLQKTLQKVLIKNHMDNFHAEFKVYFVLHSSVFLFQDWLYVGGPGRVIGFLFFVFGLFESLKLETLSAFRNMFFESFFGN